MPKRSNDFQRLIKRIFEQLVPRGASVTESALLLERPGGVSREIDILIETPGVSPDRPMRTAVECRDHRRKADTTWIDEIHGKYRDIDVDRVVVVSRSGFTRGAERKARQCGIQMMTLADALETDWPAQVFGVKFEEVSYWPHFDEIHASVAPAWPSGEKSQTISVDGTTPAGEAFLRWLLEEMANAFGDYVGKQRSLGNTAFDEPGTFAFSTTLLELPVFNLRSPSGAEHRAEEITLIGSVEVKRTPLRTSRYLFDGAAVSHSPTVVDMGRTEITTVQRAGGPIRVKISRRPESKAPVKR